MSNGRFKLGLGTANVENVIRPLGVRFEKPVGRLRDSIVVIRKLLQGERVTFDGVDDHLRGVRLDFDADPNIPIYIGTRGSQTLELSGQLADGVLVESLFNAGGLPHVLECIQRGVERAQRSRFDLDVIAWQVVLVTDNPAAAMATQKPWIARGLQIGPADNMVRVGVDPEVVRTVADAMNRGDRATAIAHVPDEAVQCLMVVGTPDQVSEQIAGIFKRGANTVTVLSVGSVAEVAENLRRFAMTVAPALGQ
jgi:5,10-methylenetetrahydromethanopterin reductase